MDTTFNQFAFPGNMLIAGPTMSGKTCFLNKMIEKRDKLFNTKFKRILWCYSEDTAKPKIKDVEAIKGLPSEEELSGVKPLLLIIDDNMQNASKDSKIFDIFTKESHHRSIFTILVLQNLFFKGKFTRDLSMNAQYLVIFRNLRDKQQFSFLSRQLYPENPKELLRVYKDITREPYTYLLIDLSQRINNLLRFRTDIFKEDYICVVYSNIKDGECQAEEIEGQQTFSLHIETSKAGSSKSLT